MMDQNLWFEVKEAALELVLRCILVTLKLAMMPYGYRGV